MTDQLLEDAREPLPDKVLNDFIMWSGRQRSAIRDAGPSASAAWGWHEALRPVREYLERYLMAPHKPCIEMVIELMKMVGAGEPADPPKDIDKKMEGMS